MFELIILFILIIGAVSIYQSLPETKFNKAVELMESGDLELALEKFIVLKEKHDKAIVKIAELKILLAENMLKSYYNDFEYLVNEFKSILNLRNEIKRSTFDENGLSEQENKARNAIAKIYCEKGQELYEKNELDKASILLTKALKWSKIESVKTKATIRLAFIEYKKGIINEKQKKILNAVNHYKVALTLVEDLPTKKLYYDLNSRIQICKLKEGKRPNKLLIGTLSNKNIDSKNDLMFRYALHLAKHNKIGECEEIINTYFGVVNNREVRKLRAYCQDYHKQKAIEKITIVNEVIFGNNTHLNNNQQLSDLYQDFDTNKTIILKGFPKLSDKVQKIKPYLFSRLISQYFEEEKFEELIRHISSFENFYKEPDLLKNIGIACLRLTNNQKLTSDNYKNIISTWLTAVYSNEVILNSLETTNWDDEYNFTLIDSIGSRYQFENDVENVNFDEVSNGTISIGDTQRQLVAFFENALNEISDTALSHRIQLFYQSEKEAIEKIIKVLDTQNMYSAPYFAKKYNLQKDILRELASKFRSNQDMSLLQIGNLYVKNRKPAIFKDFTIVENMIKDSLAAIKELDNSKLKNQNTKDNITALQSFPRLKRQLEQEMLSAFNDIIQMHSENKRVMRVFESAISLVPESRELKIKCADFITNFTISKVNADRMDYKQALSYLIKAYELNTSNHRIINNLAVITKFNCMDMLNGVSDTSRELEKLNRISNGLLTQSLKNELAELFEGLMNQIRQNDLMVVTLFERIIFGRPVYNPYPFETLNEDGLKLAKKLKLIYELMQ